MQDYLKHMKQPKEKVEIPGDLPGLGDGPGDDKDNTDKESDEADKETLGHLNYTDEQAWWAELVLNFLDKGFAMFFGFLTAKSPENYRARTGKADADDYEVKLMAAIINKYQLRFSLEFALGTALLMKYGMVYSVKVMPDMKAKAQAQQKSDQRAKQGANA